MAEPGRVLTASSKVRLALASDEWLVACVRRGDTAAFETLYDRHVRELLAFCIYMLGSRQDAEDAVQATFTSAYRALRADTRPVTLRPWLFTIARNDCLTILRRRRPLVELNGEVAPGPDPATEIELREEVRKVFDGLRDLPDNQRAALVLAEVHGLSHTEIGGVLGVRSDQVKAYVFQARSKLISDRRARDADCSEIREELATAKGAALLRGRLRRHMRSCPDCRLYADGVARQRRQLGAILPIVPSLALKYRAVEEAVSSGAGEPATVAGGAAVGASAAGAAADLAGGGVKILVCKLAAGMVCLGASAGVGVSVLDSPNSSQGSGTTATQAASGALFASAAGPGGSAGWSPTLPSFSGGIAGGDSSSQHAAQTDSGLPVLENGAGGSMGLPGEKAGGLQTFEHSAHGQAGTTSGGGGGDHSLPGRELHERGNPAGVREAQHQTAQERLQLRRGARERNSTERKLAREERASLPRIPLSEQELAEKREQRKARVEASRPPGHSRIPRKTAEEYAEKHERHKQRAAERRRRKHEEELAAAEKELVPPAP